MIVKRKINLSELCFLIFWFFLQVGKGMGYTSRHEEYTILLICAAPFVCLRLLLIKWDTKSLLKCVSLIALGAATALVSKTTTYLLSIICIVAAKGLDIKKPLKITLLVRGLLYIIRTSLAIAGYLDMEEMYRFSQGSITTVRYALGYGHANTAQYELFMLIMVFYYLYQERLRIYHFLLALVYNQYIFSYTDSKTSFYLCPVFIFAVFICLRRNGDLIRRAATSVATKSWIIGGVFTVLGCLAFVYIPEFRSLGTFASRFLTATTIIRENALPLFGQAEIVTDLGYINLLYSGGAVLTVLFFAGINRILKIPEVTSNIVLVFVFACFSVFNIMESYTYSVLSNCFLLFLSQVVYSRRKLPQRNYSYV